MRQSSSNGSKICHQKLSRLGSTSWVQFPVFGQEDMLWKADRQMQEDYMVDGSWDLDALKVDTWNTLEL